MAPKAVIFDYGCVLSRPQDRSAFASMAALLGVNEDALSAAYWRYREPYDRAGVTAEAYWRKVAEDLAIAFDPAVLPELIAFDNRSWADPNWEMLPWVSRLQNAGLRTAILSNMPIELREYLDRSADWFPEFDHRTFSCDVLASKPAPVIYEHCLSGLDVRPQEAVFFDDRMENVEAARRLGIEARLFRTAHEVSEELESWCHQPR